jgi:hypothetical protein
MGQAISAMANVRGAFQLKVSARGALIRSVFGSTLMYWAAVFSGKPTPARFSMVAVPALALTLWAIAMVRATRALPSSQSELEHWRAVRRYYWLDVGLEWGLLGAVVLALARIGRFDLMPQVLGVIVGLHYFPLGKIFRGRQYYWTGGVMVTVALASLLTPYGQIRNVVGCAAVGWALWVSAFAILCWIAGAVRSRTQSHAQ